MKFMKWINAKRPNVKMILIKKYAATCIRTGITLLQTLLLGVMIESIFYEKNVRKFFLQVILYILIFGVYVILGRKAANESEKLQIEIHGGMRSLLYSKEIRASGKDMQLIKPGEDLQLFAQDIDSIFNCLDKSLENIVVSVIGIIGIIVIVGFYNWLLAFVIFGFSIITAAITNLPNGKYQKARIYFRENHSRYLNWVNEHLRGMRDIRINQAEAMFQEMFDKHTYDDLKAKEKIRFIEIKAERLVGFVSTVLTVLFWAASAFMILYASLTVGLFYVINRYFDKMIKYLSIILQEKLNIQNDMPGYEKIRNYCEMESEQEIQQNEEKMNIGEYKNAVLRFHDISFSYGNKNVIDNMNVEFEPGKMNVLAGTNGAGKTTLMNLILRFYQAENGMIEYDGKDISKYSLEEWRKCIGYVQQDTLFFEGSLRDNICLYAPDIKEERIWEALKTAGLYETVMEWEDHIDTDIMKGERLSEGQKQRVAIARIIAKNPKIILMDEPTANLDYDIEKEIIADIKEVCKEQILIVISHRSTVMRQADKVFVIDKGRTLKGEWSCQ
ncbi:MAG: ABC transporter ATP-binding protein/permease [Lachnospiraceae bacterium]|nr:ABC transporter ATP-binding protein/permease [Lachnospiraceae bacterium]